MHLCTTKSFRAGIDLPPMDCPLCGCNTVLQGWVDSSCDTCGWNSEHYLSDNLRIVREKTGLTRRDISELSGLKIGTIKSYEWKIPSTRYTKWFIDFISKFYEA